MRWVWLWLYGCCWWLGTQGQVRAQCGSNGAAVHSYGPVNSDTKDQKINQDSLRYIPVVSHLVHNGGLENVSDAQLESQVEVLNQDFARGQGPDSLDTRIRFCLARVDPLGQCTGGIVRIKSQLTFHLTELEEAQLKALSRWPSDRYLNIWVVKALSGGIVGYTRNSLEGPLQDGIVMRYGSVGNTALVQPPYDMGHACTHEVGHWLGLLHPFEGGCPGPGSRCDTSGDLVCDTPPAAEPNYSCPIAPWPNTCNEGANEKPDPADNYMDYTPDACAKRFTMGQAERMRWVLARYRQSILGSECASNECGTGPAPPRLRLWPNPVSNVLNWRLAAQCPGTYTLVISDDMGRIHLQQAYEQPFTDWLEQQLDISHWPRGSYHLTLWGADGAYTLRWLKEE